jgi:hypothetical protein
MRRPYRALGRDSTASVYWPRDYASYRNRFKKLTLHVLDGLSGVYLIRRQLQWHAAFLVQLRDVALRLEVIYSTCVTARLALEGQHTERDRSIARCLRMGVSEPVTKEVERIGTIIAEVGGTTCESLP